MPRCFALPYIQGSLQHRRLGSMYARLTANVAEKCGKIASAAYFQDEKLVTAPRSKIEPVASSPETLAERVARQRHVRQKFVPMTVKIDKSRQYIEFVWPADAVAHAHALQEAGSAAAVTAPREALANPSPTIAVSKRTEEPLRTWALAEYLRVYTTSTDGHLGNHGILIYGRRGITITDAYPVGSYALRLCYSDGHTGGLYSYEYLYNLTSPENKYRMMRTYIKTLKQQRKVREPPRRAPSPRHRPSTASPPVDLGRPSNTPGEGGDVAPAFSASPPRRL